MSQPQQVFRLSDVTSKIPFTCRLITVIIFCIWVADIFTSIIGFLANNANLTWAPSYQIWRIFTASFCISSLFTLFMAAINCYTFLPKLEFRIGSINLLMQFFVIGAVIQLIYTFIYVLLPQGVHAYIAKGDFSGIWFSFIFKYCYYNNNNKIKLCCFPFKISKISYPFVFLAFLCLWQFQIKLDCIIGILIAFIQLRIFKGGNVFQFGSDLFLGFLANFGSWVRADSIMGSRYCYESLEEQIQVPKWSTSTKQSQQDYFRDKKGVRLGDAS